VRSAERRVNNLETGSKQTDIDSAAADVVILKDRLDQAQKDFASYENKPEDNLTRAEMLSKLADAREKYDNALRMLNNLQGSASDIDLAIADANLSLAQAQLDLAQQQYEDVKSGPDPDESRFRRSPPARCRDRAGCCKGGVRQHRVESSLRRDGRQTGS
jgi:HlyD family secretion protein